MRVTVAAIGRLKAGPERDLLARYLDRAERTGRGVGIGPIDIREIADARARDGAARRRSESAALGEILADCSRLVVLDERGRSITSHDLAARLRDWRDSGVRHLGIAIGGAEGIDGRLRGSASLVLALGAMTWPHQLVRVMLVEQLYRATTILAGHPYHRQG